MVDQEPILAVRGCNSVVECLLPKEKVEGSNPFTRSIRKFSLRGSFQGKLILGRVFLID